MLGPASRRPAISSKSSLSTECVSSSRCQISDPFRLAAELHLTFAPDPPRSQSFSGNPRTNETDFHRTARRRRKLKEESRQARKRVFSASRASNVWWSQTGSNRRPHACKARALPTELWPRSEEPAQYDQESFGATRRARRRGKNRAGQATTIEVVGLGGLEPPTSRLSSARSNQLSYKPELYRFRHATHSHGAMTQATNRARPLAKKERRRRRFPANALLTGELILRSPIKSEGANSNGLDKGESLERR